MPHEDRIIVNDSTASSGVDQVETCEVSNSVFSSPWKLSMSSKNWSTAFPVEGVLKEKEQILIACLDA